MKSNFNKPAAGVLIILALAVLLSSVCLLTNPVPKPEFPGEAEHVVRCNTIEFDVNGVNKLDAPSMLAFAEEVNGLLARSTLLLSSEGGEYSFGPLSADRFFERYSWLDGTHELYAEGDDLKTRLIKYSDYAISNHRQ